MDWKDCKNYGIALINIDIFTFTLNQALILRLAMKGFSFRSISFLLEVLVFPFQVPFQIKITDGTSQWCFLTTKNHWSIKQEDQLTPHFQTWKTKVQFPNGCLEVVGFWPLLWLYIKKGWLFGKMYLKVYWIIHLLLLPCIYHEQKRFLK